MEAVGIEQPAVHPIPTILERFRGQVSIENTSKEHEQNALPDILMTMSQIPVPDVALELAEVSALHALFRAVARDTEGS